MAEQTTKNRGRGRPKGTSQYGDDQGQVVADILHGIEKGNYENPNQGIIEHQDRIAGNSKDAKKKRLRRAVTQDIGHLRMDLDFSIKLVEMDGKPTLQFKTTTRTKEIFHGPAAKKK